jgi:hypothetical protein
MMQPAVEHQEITMEEDVVRPVRGPKKRRRVRNLAAERHQKKHKRMREIRGSRKVSRHAIVAWRKGNLMRQIWTVDIYGPLKVLTAARTRMIRHAKVAQGREQGLTRQGKDGIETRTQKVRNEINRRFRCPVCNNGIRNQGLKWQLQLKIVTKDPNRRWQLHHAIEKMSEIKKWILWRDRPPPKQKKKERKKEKGCKQNKSRIYGSIGHSRIYSPHSVKGKKRNPTHYILRQHFAHNGISWKFIASRAAWWGGWWERRTLYA